MQTPIVQVAWHKGLSTDLYYVIDKASGKWRLMKFTVPGFLPGELDQERWFIAETDGTGPDATIVRYTVSDTDRERMFSVYVLLLNGWAQ